MGIERIRPNGKCWRNVFLLVGGTYLFFLLLAFCFPVAGDDWFFTTRYQNEGLLAALRRGMDTAKQHFITTNGRYLGNAFSGMFGCSAVLRALFRGGVMLGILLAVCRLCKVQKISGYFLAAALVVALPPMMFGQAYAWAAGFFNYVPPLFLLLLYLCGAAPLFSEENKSDRWYHGVSFFLLGGCTQFFVENVTVAMCLLSGILWGVFFITRKRCSWKLSGHFLGTVVGAALMFLAPGYQNVGSEGYRQASHTLFGMLETAKTNFFTITKYTTEENWLLIGAITLFCLLLLCKWEGKTRKEHLWKAGSLLCLTVPLVFFYANRYILESLRFSGTLQIITFLADIAFNLLYLAGLVITICFCVKDPAYKARMLLCLLAAALSIAPLAVVNPIGPRCFYTSHLLLVCLALLLGGYALQGKRQALTLRLPAILVSAAVLVSYLWIAMWNGRVETIRIACTEQQMAEHAETIVLPSYPYLAYVHGGDGPAIQSYYYYETPGDIAFQFVPYREWVLQGN